MESVESWKMDFLPLKVRILKVENREEWAYLLAKQQNALGRESLIPDIGSQREECCDFILTFCLISRESKIIRLKTI